MPTKSISLAAIALLFAGSAWAEPLERFDVAEDLSRFVFASQPVFEDGMPAYGNPFVTQGYIYPAGTLDGDVEGTTADGAPAFPDKVIGIWTCDGFFVGDGMHTASGDIVITRQIYQFHDGSVLISQGSELADIGVEVSRAVTGGTGDYKQAPTVIRQTLLGMSEGFGVRLQFALGAEEHAALVHTEIDELSEIEAD